MTEVFLPSKRVVKISRLFEMSGLIPVQKESVYLELIFANIVIYHCLLAKYVTPKFFPRRKPLSVKLKRFPQSRWLGSAKQCRVSDVDADDDAIAAIIAINVNATTELIICAIADAVANYVANV